MPATSTDRWRWIAYVLAIVASMLIVVRSLFLGLEWLVVGFSLGVLSPLLPPIRWKPRVILAVFTPLYLFGFMWLVFWLLFFGMLAWCDYRGESFFEGVH